MAALLARLGTFLLGPLKWLGELFVGMLINRVIENIKDYLAQKKAEKEIKDAHQKYKDAKTPEDQERAFQEYLDTLNKH